MSKSILHNLCSIPWPKRRRANELKQFQWIWHEESKHSSKMEIPTKARTGENKQVAAANANPRVGRRSYKLVLITVILLRNVQNISTLFFQIHEPPTDSTPPFDPLNWAYTNCFSLLTAPCLCYACSRSCSFSPVQWSNCYAYNLTVFLLQLWMRRTSN